MNKLMNAGLTGAALAVAAVATAAIAAESYDQLDADKDGKISRGEATGSPDLYNRWREFDTNGDGLIDEGEFARFEAEPVTDEGKDPGVGDPGMEEEEIQ